MGRIALIDGDIVAFRCASSCEPSLKNPSSENESIAISRTNELLDRILSTVATKEYHIFVSGSENFRKILYPDYKRNRDDIPKPRHLVALHNFLVTEWGAEVTGGYEADDGIGIEFTRLLQERDPFSHDAPIICSIDKDFRQISGLHYNFVKDVFEEISDEEASLAFWSHMLIGDTSDNVRGVAGIGKVKSKRLLQGLLPEEQEARVRSAYGDPERFALNCKLLRILRTEGDYEEIVRDLRDETPTKESQRAALAAEGEG